MRVPAIQRRTCQPLPVTHFRPLRKLFPIALVLLAIAPRISYGTHLRAADIIVEKQCGSLTFKITVIAYLNAASTTSFGTNSEVLFGDGQVVRIPLTASVPRPDLGVNVSVATFSTTHTYAAAGVYSIVYIERDRSQGVLNIADSHDVPYVTSVRINTGGLNDCNHYPVLAVVPLDRGCTHTTFFHNPGAYDVDGDSLSYELTIPLADAETFANYTDPADARFYSDYAHGNESGTAPPVFKIDSLTGLITWDAPGAVGEYNIALRVVEWKLNADGTYSQTSVTVRDMQIIIEPCANSRPQLVLPSDICVVAGATVTADITGMDPESHPVKVEVFSEILEFNDPDDRAVVDNPASSFTSPPVTVRLQWGTSCLRVRQQPYQVVFKITDSTSTGPKLVSFATLLIRVVAPAPSFTGAVLDVVRKRGVIEWNGPGCDNARTIQIWRKAGSFTASPGSCTVGIPRNSGYQLVGEVDPATGTFVDTNAGNGLAPGGVYCYRLVALVGDTKSKVSIESCIGPVQRDAPVITHVSIARTDNEGSTTVSWRSPEDINRIQFPPPYEYEIWRAEGFAGENGITRIGATRDTTFADNGVNTRDSVFNYRIVLYSKPQFSETFIAVDTSAAASTVRLSAFSEVGAIRLEWRDSVPWSNVVESRPYHRIYRAEGIRDDTDLILYDSVNVIDNGYAYTDRVVNSNSIYTYKIVMVGTYGNPAFPLQENFSQTVSIYPVNSLVPCAPRLEIAKANCNDLSTQPCDQSVFTNLISWTPAFDDGCRVDIVSYRLYSGTGQDTLFTLISDQSGTSFEDAGLSSPARCYRVSAVDGLGRESEPGEPICNDTCPFFELPNVFSPNGDGCNDLFTARFNDEPSGECSPSEPGKCPRFVDEVDVRIYNRWGRLVHTYSSATAGSVYIDWDGTDSNGNAVAAGIYYYIANVAFNTMDASKRKKVIKSWLQLLR